MTLGELSRPRLTPSSAAEAALLGHAGRSKNAPQNVDFTVWVRKMPKNCATVRPQLTVRSSRKPSLLK